MLGEIPQVRRGTEISIIAENEPLPKHPILILGAGKGTGAKIAEQFALQGYPVIIGTTHQKHYEEVRDQILSGAGEANIRPFLADITDKDQIERAYLDLDLSEGETLHYFPLAAGGIQDVIKLLALEINPIKKKYKKGEEILREDVDMATTRIKKTMDERVSGNLANKVNFEGPISVVNFLNCFGHINNSSRIMTLSSSISDIYDLDHPENYPGPYFYQDIAVSKKYFTEQMQHFAENEGTVYVDLVAPEIIGTDVGSLLEKLVVMLSSVYSKQELAIPQVTKDQVARAAFTELQKSGAGVPRVRKAYVNTDGSVSEVRPSSWNKQLVPCF
ncbi:MAG: SDR family NAD(P)-dependent oxidoreductase [Candidatus Levyibacteriota bacterium]